jgi:uncharacterized membrane protein
MKLILHESIVKVKIMESNESKSIFKSKTFWLNVLALAVAILSALQGQMEAGISLTLFSIVNIILRSVTKESVRWNL